MATHERTTNPVLLASSAFTVGVLTGVFLNSVGRRVYERMRLSQAHRESEGTITYKDNLPETLARREPMPRAGQPRFGGTGALGVSPAAVGLSGKTTSAPRRDGD